MNEFTVHIYFRKRERITSNSKKQNKYYLFLMAWKRLKGVKTLCCVQIKMIAHFNFKFIFRNMYLTLDKSGCHMQKVTCLLERFGLPLRKNVMNILHTGGLKEE